MTTLTPTHRSAEATSAAESEGFWNGIYTLVPSIAAVVLATRHSPTFRARTNMQSRTAIAIMPAMFVSALTSELKLSDKMHEIAHETQHTHDTVHWAERQWQQHGQSSSLSEAEHLSALYQESIRNSGVQIVPQMHWYHHASNYATENPLKTLAGVSVPAVAYIWTGRQSHLQLQSKIMHTRIFGQFFVIASLLGIMGFQSVMHEYGRFMSQEEADLRVAEMQRVRADILARQQERERLAEEAKQELRDLRDQSKSQKKAAKVAAASS